MKILIIEDEPDMREVIKASLEQELFVVETADDLVAALDKISTYHYDCILLDIMLPGGSGLQVLEALKKQKKRDNVLIISARNSVEDKVKGLNLGADDYLPKPFHLSELTARVKSIIRRNKSDGQLFVQVRNIKIYMEERTLEVNDRTVILARKEFDILVHLIHNRNRLVNKAALAEHIWGDDIDQADNFEFIYSQIKNLRKKLKDAGADIELQAVYGFGYKLVAE